MEAGRSNTGHTHSGNKLISNCSNSQNKVSNTGEVRKLKAVCSNAGHTHTHTHTVVTKVRFLYTGLQQALILRDASERTGPTNHASICNINRKGIMLLLLIAFI